VSRFLPESANRPDWPRLVAQVVNALVRRDDWTEYPEYADDAAASAGGVKIGERYRTGSVPKVRIS
jgi:hypothetical protein